MKRYLELEEDSIETDSATPLPAKRPRTRATAAARNAAWSVHATAAAHFVDASPRIPAPGSIAAACMEPGKVYRLIYIQAQRQEKKKS